MGDPNKAVKGELRLYIAGQTARSIRAFKNVTEYCDAHCPGAYRLEIIDLCRTPGSIHEDSLVALPSLVRRFPTPLRRITGDLSNHERLRACLEMDS